MADDKYTFRKVPEEYYYEFYSDGPKGSTAARTRLYHMNIFAYWNEISEATYLIQGYLNGSWQSFEKGVNFEDFIIRKKF